MARGQSEGHKVDESPEKSTTDEDEIRKVAYNRALRVMRGFTTSLTG